MLKRLYDFECGFIAKCTTHWLNRVHKTADEGRHKSWAAGEDDVFGFSGLPCLVKNNGYSEALQKVRVGVEDYFGVLGK